MRYSASLGVRYGFCGLITHEGDAHCALGSLRACAWEALRLSTLHYFRESIIPFAWENMPYTASWVLDISSSTRDHVKVAMEDSLARHLAIVDADIEPLYLMGPWLPCAL